MKRYNINMRLITSSNISNNCINTQKWIFRIKMNLTTFNNNNRSDTISNMSNNNSNISLIDSSNCSEGISNIRKIIFKI